MQRFLAILLAALSLFLIFLVVAVLLFGWIDSKPHVPDRAVVRFDISGAIEEHQPEPPLSRLAGLRHVTLLRLLRALEYAAEDARVGALWVRIGDNDLGWAKLDELRAAIGRARKAGKYVVAELGDCDDRLYYLALAADRIEVSPESVVMIDGLMARYTFLRGTLDKLGIEAQVEAFGEYKSAGDIFSRTEMSPAEREEAEELLDDGFARLVEAIAGARKVERDQVLAWLDDPVYSASELVRRGLADGSAYPDQIREHLRQRLKLPKTAELEPVDAIAYAGDEDESGDPAIAVVYAVGTIGGEESGFDPVFGKTVGWKSLNKALQEAADDHGVKAIVLRVDSPGGAMLASDLIWRAAKSAAAKKPVVASMSDLAASGGYYIAMAAHRIVAEPSSLTGSIGVVATLFSLEGAYGKLGFSHTVLKRGRWADTLDDSRPLAPEQRERFRSEVRHAYERFVSKVAAERKRARGEIEAVARGRVWSGAQALEVGLVDELGDLHQAIAVARKLAHLDPDEEVALVIYPKPKDLFESLARSLDFPAALRWPSALDLARDARAWLGFHRGQPLTLTPRVPEIR